MIRIDKEKQKKCKYYCGGKSVAVPNQALSLERILNDFSSGAYSEFYRIGTYDEQANFDSLCPEDFKDIAELDFACRNSAHVLDAYKRALLAEEKAQQVTNQDEKLNALRNETQTEIKD